MHEPFFSIVVCTYNRAHLLPRALRSLEVQTLKNFELIVIDDGSTDQTRKVVEEYKKSSLIKTRYFKLAHKGLGNARQFGLRKAKGLYTSFLDSDDVFLKEHLSSRFRLIQKYPKIDMFFNGFKTIGSKMVPDAFNEGKFLHVDHPVIFHAATMFVKTKKALKVGGFNKITTPHYPDNFMEVAKKYKFKIHRVNKRTYVYYRTSDSMTYKSAENIL